MKSMAKEMNVNRRRIEAEEDAVLDIQFSILDLLRKQGLSKEELAKRLGVSKARVSQLFAAGANPTVKQIARIYDALDRQFVPTTCELGSRRVLNAQAEWSQADVFRIKDALRNVQPFRMVQSHADNENWSWGVRDRVAA